MKKLINTITLILIFERRNSNDTTKDRNKVFAKKETMFIKNIDPDVAVAWILIIELRLSLNSPPDRNVFEINVITIELRTIITTFLAILFYSGVYLISGSI